MGMSLTEQPDFSAERVTRPPRLIRRLSAERDGVGTTSDYLLAMSANYESDDRHSVNMLQLKRMAGFATNPNKSMAFPDRYTDAF